MAEDTATQTPSELVAEQLRRARSRKGWTQQQLADRLEEIGVPLGRSAVAKIEAGARGITFDEVLAFAVALDVPPSSLAIPRSSYRVQLTPEIAVRAEQAQSWWRGVDALDPADQRFFDDSCTDMEATVRREFPNLIEIQRNIEHAMFEAFAMVRTLGNAVIGSSDEKAEHDLLAGHDRLGSTIEQIRDEAEQVLRSLDRHRKQALERARQTLEGIARDEPERLLEMQRKAAEGSTIVVTMGDDEDMFGPRDN